MSRHDKPSVARHIAIGVVSIGAVTSVMLMAYMIGQLASFNGWSALIFTMGALVAAFATTKVIGAIRRHTGPVRDSSKKSLEHNHGNPPDPYDDRLHPIDLVFNLGPALLVVIVCPLWLYFTAKSVADWLWLGPVAIVALWFAYRAYYIWGRRNTANPMDGKLWVENQGHWWLLLRNSPPNAYDLTGKLDTPKQAWYEQIFFKRSAPLVVSVSADKDKGRSKNVTIKHFRDVDKIVKIKKWHDGEDLRQQTKQTELAREAVELQREEVDLLSRQSLMINEMFQAWLATQQADEGVDRDIDDTIDEEADTRLS